MNVGMQVWRGGGGRGEGGAAMGINWVGVMGSGGCETVQGGGGGWRGGKAGVGGGVPGVGGSGGRVDRREGLAVGRRRQTKTGGAGRGRRVGQKAGAWVGGDIEEVGQVGETACGGDRQVGKVAEATGGGDREVWKVSEKLRPVVVVVRQVSGFGPMTTAWLLARLTDRLERTDWCWYRCV